MSQLEHNVIAIVLFLITWHGILKHHPLMQEEMQRWEGYFIKLFFGE